MSKELVITKTITDKICQQLMNGIPLARISKDKDMPGLTRIYKEIAKNKEFIKSDPRMSKNWSTKLY